MNTNMRGCSFKCVWESNKWGFFQTVKKNARSIPIIFKSMIDSKRIKSEISQSLLKFKRNSLHSWVVIKTQTQLDDDGIGGGKWDHLFRTDYYCVTWHLIRLAVLQLLLIYVLYASLISHFHHRCSTLNKHAVWNRTVQHGWIGWDWMCGVWC